MHENLREVGGAAFRIWCMRSGECPAAFSFSLAGVWMSVNFGHQPQQWKVEFGDKRGAFVTTGDKQIKLFLAGPKPLLY